MTAKEFDKINPVFLSINGSIPYGVWHYSILKFKLCKYNVERFAPVVSGNDRAASAARQAKEDALKAKEEIFDFLDTVDDPYKYLLSPVYKYGAWHEDFGATTIEGRYGYLKDRHSGLVNLDLAFEYARRKLKI